MWKRRWFASLVGIAILGGGAATATGGTVRARATSACSSRYPAQRDPSNPLALATAPGVNPLTGAQFFVNGPAHGLAAGAIAQLLGIDTGTPLGQPLPHLGDNFSWQRFQLEVNRLLPRHPGVAHKVALLEKIAEQPEPQRFSSFSHGGTPAGIRAQVDKVLCINGKADPGAVPIISTYFLHASLKGCPTTQAIQAYMPTFKSRIDAMVSATGRLPMVYLLELDAIGSSYCMYRNGSLGAWEAALRYEVDKVATLPHAVVYVEAGYSDSNSPRYAANVLNAIDIRRIRGFFTNDTHINWTSKEVKWGQKVSRMTHGAHFVVDTADNGNGPKLNPHPSTQGIEDLCNPPGRALGPKPTTATGFAYVDAFMWTHIPGVSSGCGGGPSGGVFWLAKALSLASRANGKLGPGYPSLPY